MKKLPKYYPIKEKSWGPLQKVRIKKTLINPKEEGKLGVKYSFVEDNVIGEITLDNYGIWLNYEDEPKKHFVSWDSLEAEAEITGSSKIVSHMISPSLLRQTITSIFEDSIRLNEGMIYRSTLRPILEYVSGEDFNDRRIKNKEYSRN